MTCRHILGAWADYNGNVHYEYEYTDQLYPVDVFKFCPECGEKIGALFSQDNSPLST